MLLSVLDGIRAAGTPVTVDSADLTERRMYLQVRADAVAAHAPTLLAGYTSPFSGARGADNPTVFAGFVIVNSETGHGSFSIIPRLVVEVCRNGLTITKDILRKVHLGARLEKGVIRWSDATRAAALDLVTKQATDAVTSFLDIGYVQRRITELERTSGVRVQDPVATIQHVSSQLRFTDEQRDTILNHFIDGGDRTAGGILHAVTSTAQTQPDADAAYHLEQQALRAMTLAATHQG